MIYHDLTSSSPETKANPMKETKFECPSCKQSLAADFPVRGIVNECPNCETKFVIQGKGFNRFLPVVLSSVALVLAVGSALAVVSKSGISKNPVKDTTIGDSPENQSLQKGLTLDESKLIPLPASQKQVDELKETVDSMRVVIKYLIETSEKNKNNIDEIFQEDATFNPSIKSGYDFITGKFGSYPVMTEHVEEYLSGVKLTIRIGNPYSGSIYLEDIEYQYGKDSPEGYIQDKPKEWSKWFASIMTIKVQEDYQLVGGRWNYFEVILPNIDPSEFKYVRVSFKERAISLGGKR